MNRQQPRARSISVEVRQLFGYLSHRRRRQLGVLLILIVCSSVSETVSVGAIFPFLGALSNAQSILVDSAWQPFLVSLNITSASALVTVLAVLFITAVSLATSVRVLTTVVRERLAAAIGSDISSQIYQKILLQPYEFHVQQNSSDLLQTLTSDTNQLVSGVLKPLLSLATNALLAPSLVGALIIIDARIAISAAGIFGVTYTLIYKQRKKLLLRNSRVITSAGQQRIKSIQEGVGGIRDVVIGDHQAFFLDIHHRSERMLKSAKANNQLIASIPGRIIEAIALCAIAILAVTLGSNGDFSQAVPILGSLALGAKRLLPVLQETFVNFSLLQSSKSQLERVLTALQRSVDPARLTASEIQARAFRDEIRLEDLWFRYSKAPDWTLKGMNLTIKARTTVGFVGSTGSGKSTTVDILMGLLQPQKGHLVVDGQRLDQYQIRQWQHAIAHVPQSIFLTDATLAENIAFGISREKIDMDRVIEAARLAQIDDYVKQLPQSYSTYVGERGVRLSGGQRQRIGIARALYKRASVIVFDEATSALDQSTERQVMSSIDQLSKRYTIIIIAHRLSTVEKCDHIFELSQGKIIAEGPYNSLALSSESFREMISN